MGNENTGATMPASSKKIMGIPYSRLLKLEVQKLANDVMRIVESHNPEELQIDKIYDLLVDKSPKVKRLIVQYGAHPITKQLKKFRDLRSLHVQAIKFALKKAAKLDATGEDPQVLIATSEITRFLNKLNESKNELVMLQKLDQFLSEVDINEPLDEALEALGITDLMNDLRITLADNNYYLNKRATSIAQRPKMETALLRKEIVEAIDNMFREIELAQLRNPTLDYTALIDELNGMLRNMGGLVNRRTSYNQRKADGKTDGDNSNGPDEGTEGIETTMFKAFNTGFDDIDGDDLDMDAPRDQPDLPMV